MGGAICIADTPGGGVHKDGAYPLGMGIGTRCTVHTFALTGLCA